MRHHPMQRFRWAKALRSVILIGTALWLATMMDVTMAGFIGSAHDFGTGGCSSCHTLHKSSGGTGTLWDHEITTATFTLYTSPLNSLDATINSPSDFGSKLCLSCHDGTVAIDSYGGVTGTTFITGPSNLDFDLSDDHPVSFIYNTSLANTDGELKDPAIANSGLGGTIQGDLLVNDYLECNSCHNIHSSNTKLLVVSNAGSSLCLTCHNK